MSTQTINNNNTTDSTTSTVFDPKILKQAADQSSKRDSKKRSSKKDRHSKINTAHGPRDRRMRLSLDVAQEFFGLQDILGFEKASKTVEWLLTQSKSAIKELTRASNGLNSNHSSSVGASSTSECEVLSGTDELVSELNEDKCVGKAKGKGSGAKDKKRKGVVRRVAFDSTAREMREKARERARERTTRKRKELNLSQLGRPSPASGELGTQNGSFEVQLPEVEKPSSHEREVDHEQGSSRDHDMIFSDSFWSSSAFFNYQPNSTSSHESAEFQAYGKLWEGYNN